LDITIFQYERLTGYDTFVFSVAKALRRKHHTVKIVTSDQLPLVGTRQIFSHAKVASLLSQCSWIELPFLRLFPYPKSFDILRQILASSNIIYVKNELFDLIPVLAASRSARPPIICGIHTALSYANVRSLRALFHNSLYRSILYKKLLSSCKIIHVINRSDGLSLGRMGIDSRKLRFLPLWIDTERYRPSPSRVIDQRFRVLYVGAIDSRKGIDVFLGSIKRIHVQDPGASRKIVFSVVGTGPLAPSVREAAARYPNVLYSESVGDMVEEYNRQDLVVVPSRGETFSYVTLEALSCGVPVIASSVPGPTSMIRHGRTGLFVPPGDMDALAKAILRMYQTWMSHSEYEEVRSECRRSALEKYSEESVTASLDRMFADATYG